MKRPIIAAGLVALLAAACTSAGSSTSVTPTSPPPPTTATTTPITSAPPPTTTSSTLAPTTTTVAPTTTAGDPCATAPPPVPAGAAGVSTAEGDFDGDGMLDELMVYQEGPPGLWHLRVTLAAGQAADITLPGAELVARAIGGHDLDLDGDEEVFAVVGAGASADIVGIYTLLDCEVVPVTIDGTDAASQFPIGASARNQSGLQCLEAGGLAVYTQTTDDGVTYDQQLDEYGVEETVMTLEGSLAFVLTSPIDNGQILVAGDFDCGDLSLF